jgi:hypothetical protein
VRVREAPDGRVVQGLPRPEAEAVKARWLKVVCLLTGHDKKRRALTFDGTLYLWATCWRCGRHVSGKQPPWELMLADAVTRRLA